MPHNDVFAAAGNPTCLCAQPSSISKPYEQNIILQFPPLDDVRDQQVLDGVLETLLSTCTPAGLHPCTSPDNIG